MKSRVVRVREAVAAAAACGLALAGCGPAQPAGPSHVVVGPTVPREPRGSGAPAPSSAGRRGTPREERLDMGRFGHGTWLRPAEPNGTVVLVVAEGAAFRGDAGAPPSTAAALARTLAERGAIVGELDVDAYLQRVRAGAHDECFWPTIDLQTITKHVGKGAGLPRYVEPVVVGIGRAASLAVTAAAQAKPGMFRAVVTSGFCADLALPAAPCDGGVGLGWRPGGPSRPGHLTPPREMPTPWVALESKRGASAGAGAGAPRCNAGAAETFVASTPSSRLEWVDGSSSESVVAALVAAVEKEAASAPVPPKPPAAAAPAEGPATSGALAPVDDLPLVEMPATAGTGDTLAVFVSGDGGWAALDQQVSEYLNQHGVPVVGLSSMRYFWTAHSPDSVAADLDRLTRHYLRAWNKQRVLWVGYSAGADAFAYLAARMPEDLRARVRAIALIGPGTHAEFEFHVSDWIPGSHAPRGAPILPEVLKIEGIRLICFRGTEETESLCPQLPPGRAEQVSLEGGHHFGGDYPAIGEAILASTPR